MAEPDRRHFNPHFTSRSGRKHQRYTISTRETLQREREQREEILKLIKESDDEITKQIQERADIYTNIWGKSHKQLEEIIREDQIDILIDLAGHTAHNRLLTFIRKPAPIQITWIGYPATTGLTSMDYKIVDYYTNPPGNTAWWG